MDDGPIIEETVFASASMDVALDAVQRGDWHKAEQALLDVQERAGRLLQEHMPPMADNLPPIIEKISNLDQRALRTSVNVTRLGAFNSMPPCECTSRKESG